MHIGPSELASNTLYEIEIEWHDGTGLRSAGTHVINTYRVDSPNLSRTETVNSFAVLGDTYTTNTGIGWSWNSSTQSSESKLLITTVFVDLLNDYLYLNNGWQPRAKQAKSDSNQS
jgi:hypothetical protein